MNQLLGGRMAKRQYRRRCPNAIIAFHETELYIRGALDSKTNQLYHPQITRRTTYAPAVRQIRIARMMCDVPFA